MVYDLKGKVIIRTEANSGIEKAAVVQPAKPGATVVTAVRSRERGVQGMHDLRNAAQSTKVALLPIARDHS